MKHTRFVTTILTILSATIFTLQAQDQATLRFTGQNQNGQHVTLSTVTVENVTHHWQEMLYYPDTVLTIGPVGIHDPQSEGKGVRLFQNVPNPFDGVTDFVLHLPEASAVTLEICDVNGSVTATYTGSLDQGDNCFRAWLSSPQTYLLSARTEGGTVRIKMVNAGSTGQNCIEYLGKSSPSHMAKSDDNAKGSTNLPFTFGDWMLYQGSAHIAGTDFSSEPLFQSQNASELITLTFNLPLPTVTTEAATNITPTEAKLNGLVVETSGYPVFSRGFLITDNAQLAGASDYTDGAGGGSFHYEVSGLQMGTRYYYRAYAMTDLGITYGDILYFDTQSDLPEVHTFMVTDTAIHGAVCGGNVTYDGGSAVTARGVCWSTTQSPTLSNIHTSDGSGVGSFTSHIFGLYANTTYYVRAYATNSVGTAYGEERSFTTLTSDTVIGPFYCGIDSVADYDGNRYPTVEIGTQCWMKENLRTTHYPDGMTIPEYPSSYDNYRRASGDNSGSVPIYGYLYNMGAAMHGANANDSNPDGVQGICPEGWHIPSRTESEQLMNFVGSQSQYTCNGNNISKALASTTRWENGAGVTPPLSLCSPKMDLPSNNATGFSALPAGFFSSNFYYHDEARFFCYDSFSFFGSGLGDGGQDTEEKTFRDWGDISFNSSYSVVSVRCLLNDSGVDSSTAVLPVVSLTTLDDISASSASCTGFVTASGGSVVTARGFCWSTSPNPSVGGSHTSEGIGTGRFNSEITGLSPGTTYYMRPYATSDVGTAYGEERSFTTYWPDSCGGSTVMDFDGNIYRTIQIGTQCWLRENLRATHFADGTAIALGYNATTYATTPYRFAPWNGDNEAVPIFGYLYNRAAALHGSDTSSANPSGLQGVCPAGWHVPSAAEWHQLVDYVGSQAEYRCGDDSNLVAKALASTKFWSYSDNECSVGNTPATNNASGFSALPAGCAFLEEAVFWITDDPSNVNVDHACLRSSCSDFCGFNSTSHGQNSAFSVRCLRD